MKNSVKLLLLADLHLTPAGKPLGEVDPCLRLRAALRDMAHRHGDAEALFILGDLSFNANEESYRRLTKELAVFPLPWRLVPGNHDKRAPLLEALPGLPVDERGYLHSVMDVGPYRLILLDTLDEGHPSGRLGPHRMAWLKERLLERPQAPTYLFSHHPAAISGIDYMDRHRLAQPEDLAALLAGHPQVVQLFWGHLHRNAAGVWAGKPFAILRSLVNQVEFRQDRDGVWCNWEEPVYGVLLINSKQTFLHYHEFLRPDDSFKVI